MIFITYKSMVVAIFGWLLIVESEVWLLIVKNSYF